MNIILIIAITIAVIFGWLIYSTGFWQRVKQFSNRSTAEVLGGKLEALDQTIGEADPICPTCGSELEQKPSPKEECPHCGNNIYNRKRPYDNQNVLVTEDELVEIQEQWAIVNGEHNKFLKEQKRKERIKNDIKKQTGSTPTPKEVELEAMQQQARELEQSANWGLARNKRMHIADRLRENGEAENALQAYFEVCYLDANGPRNVGNISAGKNSPPAFSEDIALITPGVLKKVVRLIKKLDLNLEEIKTIYIETAENTYQRINDVELPKNPSEGWEEFRDTIT